MPNWAELDGRGGLMAAISSGNDTAMGADASQDASNIAALGDFPFALDNGHGESGQAAWLRGNSSYMNQGFVGYLSAIGLLARGIIVNLLVTMPVLILAGLVVAALNITGWGFKAALAIGVTILAWVVIAPVVIRLHQVAMVRRTVKTGMESSVAARSRRERVFGFLILALVLATAAETASYILDDFHFWIREQGLGFTELGSVGAVLLPLAIGAGRALPQLAGLRKGIALSITGAVGLLLPILIVLFVADYIVFDVPARAETLLVVIAGGILCVLMVLALVLGLALSAAFTPRFIIQAVLAVVCAFVALAVGGRFAEARFLDDAAVVGELQAFVFTPPPGDPDADAARRLEIDTLANRVGARPSSEMRALSLFVEESRARPGLVVTLTAPEPSLDTVALIEEVDLLMALPVGLDSASDFAQELREHLLTGEVVLTDFESEEFLQQIRELRTQLARLTPLYREDSETSTLAHAVMGDFSAVRLQDFYPRAEAAEQFANLYFIDGVQVDRSAAEGADELAPAVTIDRDAPTLVNGHVLPLVDRYRLLASGPQIGAFEALDNDMRVVSNLISDARVEIARVATRSSQYPILRAQTTALRLDTFESSALFAIFLSVVLWAYGWLAVDPNRTSLHAWYRDRLASTFLVGPDPMKPGCLRVEPDHNLSDLSRYELGSTAPYHLINCAVNLQASRTLRTQSRKSDFFIFSKRFIGSEQTGYCRSSTMDKVMPELSVQMAMAVSAAAAAPNMGRATTKALTALMVFGNARLGQWIPNPGRLDETHGSRSVGGYSAEHVLAEEMGDVLQRWQNLGPDAGRSLKKGVFGIAYSGGGVRSASLNLGITQALVESGVFRHIDYMSTVSGGGYLGTGISVGMRSVLPVRSPVSGEALVNKDSDPQTVSIDGGETYEYDKTIPLIVDDRQIVQAGERLVARRRRTGDGDDAFHGRNDFSAGRGGEFGAQFYWRARPTTLFKEMTGQLHERGRSVNLSDGGHIENLAAIELLRRKCRFVIIGDAEDDSRHSFKGLGILIRTARVEFGAEIEIDLAPLQLDDNDRCTRHYAVGTITYRDDQEAENVGTLLYLKSSLTGAEPVDIDAYRRQEGKFPHQSTADQFFDEGQFESYRSLGYCMAKAALAAFPESAAESPDGSASFAQVEEWFRLLLEASAQEPDDALVEEEIIDLASASAPAASTATRRR